MNIRAITLRHLSLAMGVSLNFQFLCICRRNYCYLLDNQKNNFIQSVFSSFLFFKAGFVKIFTKFLEEIGRFGF